MMAIISIGSIFAQEANPIVFSGNVSSGLKVSFSDTGNYAFAFADDAGSPFRINFRMDYNFDDNAGLTVNLRSTATGQSLGASSRAIPYVNRGFAWVKFFDGKMRVRSGYLWDTDYESDGNAWDTASVLEWCTSLDFYPIDGMEVGLVVPTSIYGRSLESTVLDTTYGLNWNITDFGRISAMFQYGSVVANRSLNFGLNYTGIKGLSVKLEGDLQQIGIDDIGYYQLYESMSYSESNMSGTLAVTECIFKSSDYHVVTPSISFSGTFDWVTITLEAATIIGADMSFGTTTLEANMAYHPNPKSTIKIGVNDYILTTGENVIVPFVNFVMGF